MKETKQDGREEARYRWQMVSSLVSTAKSFTMTDKHNKMFKKTTKKFKTSKQLMADRHDEVHRFLMLDDVDMTPGNKVNTTNIDSRAEASSVSFKGTAKVLLFASKLRKKAKASRGRKGGSGGGGVLAAVNSASMTTDREMRKRLSFARMGMKRESKKN